MKNLLLTLITGILFTVSVDAQKLNFGLKAGLNLANQDYEAEGFSISPDSRLGFHAGAYLTYMLSDRIGLQPELMYSQEGSEWDMDNEKVEVNIDYLSLPILIRYQPIDLLNLHLGPQFSYRLNAEGNDESIDDETKEIEIAGAAGAGIDLPIGVGLTVRYIFGLTDAFDLEDVTVKNSVFQISATYRFGQN